MTMRPHLVVSAVLLAILALGLVVWLVWSGEPRIRGASNEAFTASLAAIRARLPAGEHARFDDAVATLMAGRDDQSAVSAVRSGEVPGDVRARLDGKGARDLLALADDLRAKARAEAVQRAKARLESLTREIAPLARIRDEDEAAARELAKVTCTNTTLTQRFWNQQIGRIISLHLTVRNGSERVVSRMVMTGTITSAGRASPWLAADFPWESKGGLQPGNEETLHLNPGSFNGEPRLEVTPDMRLGVSVIELTAPDGARIAKPAFSEEERKRLATLERDLVDARKHLADVESAVRNP